MKRGRAWLIVGAAAIGVVLALLVWLLVARAAQSGSRSALAIELPAADVARIEAALPSQDIQQIGESLSPDVRASFLSTNTALLPAESQVTLDTANAVGIAGVSARVPITVTGPQQGNYEALLVFDSGRWLVLGTVPK